MTESADSTDRDADRQLWEQLRRSDHGAFDTLFRAHYAALVGVAERMLREREAAEEIVQDIYAEIWRRRETLVVEGTLRAYLFRSTRNRALNHIRHHRIVQKSEHLVEPVTPMPAPSESIREQEIRDAVQQAVATLPDRCREVFQLSREGGLRYTEIAESMGISVKTVEAQMGKALRILRERLSAWLVDPPSG